MNRNFLKAAGIIFITLLAYIPAIQGGFIWDDDKYVTENQVLRSYEGLKQIFLEPRSIPQYYPLVHASFWIEYQLWQLWPAGYHIVNVILHALSAVILWRILMYLGIPASWTAAAIFALHPGHVESAAWITERKNVLSALFYLGSAFCLLCFFRLGDQTPPCAGDTPLPPSRGDFSASSPSPEGIFDGLNLRYYGVALFLFISALLSKTVTCSLPAAILLIIWWKHGRIRLREILLLLPFFLLGIGLGLLTVWLERYHVGALGPEWNLSFIERCLIAGRALWFYAGKLFLPVDLIFIYPRWEIDAHVWRQYLYPATVLTVILAFWIFRSRLGRGALTSLLFFCGTLFPGLGFFDVYPFIFSYVADHFQYLASIGLIVPAAVLYESGIRKIELKISDFKFRSSGIAVLLLMLGVLTWHQGYVYENLETLWTETLKKNPDAWMPHNNLGPLLFQKGKIEEAIFHFQEALRFFQEALRLKPDYKSARKNLDRILAIKEKQDTEIAKIRNKFQDNPNHPKLYCKIGDIYESYGQSDKAAEQYRKALSVQPEFTQALNRLAILYVSMRKDDDALFLLNKSLRIQPNSPYVCYHIACIFARQHQTEEAVFWLKEAVGHGFKNWHLLKLDDNLKNIRDTEYYKQLIAH